MTKNKFYAVRAGRKPGIYPTWVEAEAQVKGFEGARHKAFNTLAEARAWLDGEQIPIPAPALTVPPVSTARPALAAQPSLLTPEPDLAAAPDPDAPEALLYTDGAAIGNPGPGGYAAVLTTGGKCQEVSGGYRLTTNNRMELMGVIAGLSALDRPARVLVRSDSSYVVKAVTLGWMRRWQARGWRKGSRPLPNADLWQRLAGLLERHQVHFEWVRGHSGVPENERCDQLAMQAARRANLPPDVGYQPGADEE